jgi:CheY-like chemotaxis protein
MTTRSAGTSSSRPLASADLPHVAVASGTEALAQLDKVQPSLVLLDLVMPPPDGYQVLRVLRAREGDARRAPSWS